jgi:LPXTG-site transpeptidase (sortase) family protein
MRNLPDSRVTSGILFSAFSLLLLIFPLQPGIAQFHKYPPLRAFPNASDALGLGALQTARLAASNPHPLDEFGWSVAISGNTAIVGARNADPDTGPGPLLNAGAAYIFVRRGQSWIEEAKLVAADASPGDSFGVAVAIDGSTAVVGATGSDANDIANAGAAYVFVRDGPGWTQAGKLALEDPAAEDSFGTAVAIDGISIVVGADGRDLASLIDAGGAYVFVRRNKAWDQKALLLPSDPQFGGYFGSAVGISGERIIVGANQANLQAPPGPGAAYIFRGRGHQWSEEARLTLEDGKSGDFFGQAVALSGTTAVIGAAFRDPDRGEGRLTNAGAAYTFDYFSGEWQKRAELLPVDALPFDQFGKSVSISGGVIAVGANGKSQSGLAKAGSVYLYQRVGKDWIPGAKIVADEVFENDGFGGSVGVSGDWMIVGASGRDPSGLISAGEAFSYKFMPVQLPETGFAPGRFTRLDRQPESRAYADLGTIWIEIPELNVRSEIIGVPRTGAGWDTSWLWDRTGYLEGTAFPTWPGNTALAGHVFLPDGSPGPFARLRNLQWGSEIVIQAWGQRYGYEVRRVFDTSASDVEVLSHEELDWLTLITCTDFDELGQRFVRRFIVKAVLISIQEEN